MRKFNKIKQGCMLLVIVGASICALISFRGKEYVVGVLSFLTVVVPVIIWFTDYQENKNRDNQINQHGEKLEQTNEKLNIKADSDQGTY